jgi:hypothetical protein
MSPEVLKSALASYRGFVREIFKIRFLNPSVSAGILTVFRGQQAAREPRVDSKNAGNV